MRRHFLDGACDTHQLLRHHTIYSVQGTRVASTEWRNSFLARSPRSPSHNYLAMARASSFLAIARKWVLQPSLFQIPIQLFHGVPPTTPNLTDCSYPDRRGSLFAFAVARRSPPFPFDRRGRMRAPFFPGGVVERDVPVARCRAKSPSEAEMPDPQ